MAVDSGKRERRRAVQKAGFPGLQQGAEGTRFFSNPIDVARDRGYSEMEEMLEAKCANLVVPPGGAWIAATVRERGGAG